MKMYASVDEHISTFPSEKQEILEKIRDTIHKACPTATETIRYGIPTFQLNGKNMVHFAGYEGHIGFYPSPNGIDEFKKELEPYAKGKGTIQFSWDKDIPYDLITMIVKFRAQELQNHT